MDDVILPKALFTLLPLGGEGKACFNFELVFPEVALCRDPAALYSLKEVTSLLAV